MKHIVYTEDEAGDYKLYHAENDEKTTEQFHQLVELKQFIYQVGQKIVKIKPKYAALVQEVEDFDFVLGRSRLTSPEEPPTATPTNEEIV